MKRLLPLILFLLLALPAVKDLLIPAYFPMHDDLQILRLQQLDTCLKSGQIPCRWIPDAGFGYGYPMFNYYPPLPFYIAEGFHLIGINFFWSVKIVFLLSFLLPSFFIYLLAKTFFGRTPAFVAAIFYLYAPYHSVDVYVRGALNESWGMVWFPLTFYAAYQAITTKKTLRYTAMLAFAFAGLVTSHNVMTLIFSPLLGLWSLYWIAVNKSPKKITPLGLAAVWGVALSAFFFLPVTLEKDLVHVESMTVGYFNYMAHFVDINQMFFSRFWGYGGSIWGPDDDMAFPLGHFHWIIAALVGAIMLFKLFKNRRKLSALRLELSLLILLFVTFIYILLMHPRAIWFWDHLPLLYYAQFPWRLLAIPTFIFSFLAGYFIYTIQELKFPKIATKFIIPAVLIPSIILWNLPFFKIEKPVDITLEEKLSGALWELQTTGGIFDYLPRAASRPPGSSAFYFPEYITGVGGITDYQKNPSSLSFTAQVVSPSATLRLPVFSYPDWRVKVDGKKIDHTYDADLGRIEFNLTQGTHTITAKYHDTLTRTLSNLLSLITVVFSAILLLKNKRKL